MKRNQHRYRKIAFEEHWLKKKCFKCWETEKQVCVHHVDENHSNNSKNNLQILCRVCHIKIHRTWKKHSKETRKEIWLSNLWKLNKKVNQYDIFGVFIKTWGWLNIIQRELWYSKWNISLCCNWKRKTACWYKWEYYSIT